MRAEYPEPDPAVAARYRAKYGVQDRIFRTFDAVLRTVMPTQFVQRSLPLQSPQRILVVNAGHIGDVIISTGLLPVLHHTFPNVEIGFLTGSYSRIVVEGHPLLAQLHFLDHWYQSRAGGSLTGRVCTYFKSAPAVLREIRAMKYDIAIDVRSWFPNLVPLLWLARIPIRIAYDRLGFGPLLTHPLRYNYERRHELERQLDLLRSLNVSERSFAKAKPCLPPPSSADRLAALALLGPVKRYRILHPVASVAARDWTMADWQALATELQNADITPVITGTGSRAQAMAELIRAAAPASINTVDALSWSGLLALLQGAEAVYSVETSVGHAASALGRPVISIYGGMADPMQWAPLGAAVATNRLPCHPCLMKGGCATKDCLQGVSLDDVRAAGQAVAVSY